MRHSFFTLVSAFLAILTTTLWFDNLSVNAQTPTTPTTLDFVGTKDGIFTLNGLPFRYIGTNAYWLQLLNDQDLETTLCDIAASGVTVVRTWAFNDVSEIPEGPEDVWFQAFLPNGTVVYNNGPNGIPRLDKILEKAKKCKVRVFFSLTNNWAPDLDPSGLFPRNYLSNGYGGMDTYVKHFAPNTSQTLYHDTFYRDTQIRGAFERFVERIVTRYVEEPTLLGYEFANDPRCNSTLPAANSCNTQTITNWTKEVAAFTRTIDPNHLLASGDAGFYCVECDRVNSIVPQPVVSPRPGKKRSQQFGSLTYAKLHAKRAAREKERRAKKVQKRYGFQGLKGLIRGKWAAPSNAPYHKRQDSISTFGPNYDGTFGVDTEDLANTPGVDFSSFQMFPNQNTFGRAGDSAVDFSDISDVIQSGVDWITEHAETANTYGKPSTMTGFGIITNQTANTYAPFNSSTVYSSSVTTTEEQQVSAYDTWIESAIANGVSGIIHYQWGQVNLTSSPASGVFRRPEIMNNPSGASATAPLSPNDGYASYSAGVRGSLLRGSRLLGNSSATYARMGPT